MGEENQIWICLAHVTANQDTESVLESGKKAYVNVLGYAINPLDFEIQIKNALDEMGLILLSIEDEEPFSVRISEWEVNDMILEKAKEVEQTKNIRFTTFHAYSE